MQRTVITDIKRFAVHDGPGIRTTVFFKGCPLKCLWCHNPEGIKPQPQLAYFEHKCVGCFSCANACVQKAHSFENGKHRLDRSACISCGKCTELCPRDALRLYGKEYTIDELLPLLTEDKDFYDNSNGGVTLSGGECLLYADYCAELLKKLKQEHIHTAVDTCGYVPREAFEKVMPYTDLFLYDVKAVDEQTHRRCTGHSNRRILDNLRFLSEQNRKTEIRFPLVPGYNDSEAEGIAHFLSQLPTRPTVRILAYHDLAGSKYAALGLDNTLPKSVPSEKDLEQARKSFVSVGLTVL